jgi:hypothetical protein
MTAQPFFVVSSGRSGTAMMVKALAAAPGVTIEHEYMVHLMQPLGVRRYQGLAGADEARSVLSACHGAAVHYSEAALWGDSSNKLSWLIPDLAALFPEARFVHLVRDGRKVASSYFHKLGGECYDDRSTRILAAHLADPAAVAAPPPEKKYWWPQPRKDDPWADQFPRFDQFQRIVWHWAEVNRVISDTLEDVPKSRRLTVRLEDLRSQPSAVARLFSFLGVSRGEQHFPIFVRPHNVNRPIDHLLTSQQATQFFRIGGAMMERLGYTGQPEYAVRY